MHMHANFQGSKNRVVATILLLLLSLSVSGFSGNSTFAVADEHQSFHDFNVNVNGRPVSTGGFDPAFINYQGEVLAPIGPLMRALGATVKWDGNNVEAVVPLENIEFTLDVGANTAVIDGNSTPVTTIFSNGRVYTEIAWVAEKVERVSWDGEELHLREALWIPEKGTLVPFDLNKGCQETFAALPGVNTEAASLWASYLERNKSFGSMDAFASAAGVDCCIERFAHLVELVPPEPQYANEAWGTASWYGPRFHGGPTASGERFDMHSMTAAHPSLPFNTRVEVYYPRTGSTVVVRINNRGPFTGGRIIDLSRGAADVIGMTPHGIGRVRLRW